MHAANSVCEHFNGSAKKIIKNGEKTSHRICSHCWWQSFALENASHDCPGCVKGFPLTEYKKTTPIVVDLTGDF